MSKLMARVSFVYVVVGILSTSSADQTTKPSTYPSTKPTTRPSTYPSTKPTTRPSTYPSTKPTTRPSTYPSTKATTRSSTYPSTLPSTASTTEPLYNQCRDFISDECPNAENGGDNFLAEFEYYIPDECITKCNHDYGRRCNTIVYRPKNMSSVGRCSLWAQSVQQYNRECKMKFGMRNEFYAEQCIDTYDQDNGCNSYRYSDCSWRRPDGVLKEITDEKRCQEACEEPGPCEYYQYNGDLKECYFYDDFPQPSCDKIIGPPFDPHVEQCLELMFQM